MQFFTVGSSKIEVFETYLFDIVTTHYDHPRYVKPVLGRIYMFFIIFGYWPHRGVVGARMGLVHNLHFFTVESSKMEVFETFFFVLSSPKMTTQAM